ncbi:MAG: YlxR family protein [bacterium]
MCPHQPIRTCIACRKKAFKHELLRLVRTGTNGIEIDLEYDKPGRGAYLCFERNCIERAMHGKQPLRHLHVNPPPGFLQTLLDISNEKARPG